MTESQNPWKIETDICLIIPDIHQDVQWARAVMEHEFEATHTVFLGDFADTHIYPPPSSIIETAEFFREVIERDDVTVLLANHDSPIMESWSHNRHHRIKRPLIHACSGFTNSKSKAFNGVVSWDHWKRVRLFAYANGWLLSHAGLHPSFWRSFIGLEENLGALERDSRLALDLLPFECNPLLECGASRGGRAQVAGVTWADFEIDFEDNPELPPQIVGHTKDTNPRQKGRSFCIDTGQKTYAVIRRDGIVQIKALMKTAVSGTWVEENVAVEVWE